jgi:hypothetical protein
MSARASIVKTSWRHTRSNGKVISYGVLIIIQATAAAFAAAKSHQGASPVLAIILLALVVTIAAGIREMIREITGPESRAGKDIRKAHHLLEFISERFPTLMTSLTGAMTAGTAAAQAENIAALQNAILTETSQLIPRAPLRVALFRSNDADFRSSPYFPGWKEKPVCPGKGIPGVIRAVLEDDEVFRIYSEDVNSEKSVQTLAFRFSETCRSFVAVPVRSPGGLAGFLHVECDEERMLDQRAAAVIVALGQLLSVVATLERQHQQLPGSQA